MFGKRETIVFVVASLVLAASIAGQLQIAEVRRAQEPTPDAVAQQQAPGDWDGDGIPDAADACPARPETFNGFADQDGCPDNVTTTRVS